MKIQVFGEETPSEAKQFKFKFKVKKIYNNKKTTKFLKPLMRQLEKKMFFFLSFFCFPSSVIICFVWLLRFPGKFKFNFRFYFVLLTYNIYSNIIKAVNSWQPVLLAMRTLSSRWWYELKLKPRTLATVISMSQDDYFIE